jgi:hypothetical protein
MADLRYAIRFLWTHKAFSAAAILTLAIGLGANTALYGMLNATLRPLPLPDPEQLVVIAAEPKGDETGGFQFAFSTEQLKDLQERAEAFSDVVGFMPRIGGLMIDGKPAQFWYPARQVLRWTPRPPGTRHVVHARIRLAGPRRPRSFLLDKALRRRSRRDRQADSHGQRPRRRHRRSHPRLAAMAVSEPQSPIDPGEAQAIPGVEDKWFVRFPFDT